MGGCKPHTTPRRHCWCRENDGALAWCFNSLEPYSTQNPANYFPASRVSPGYLGVVMDVQISTRPISGLIPTRTPPEVVSGGLAGDNFLQSSGTFPQGVWPSRLTLHNYLSVMRYLRLLFAQPHYSACPVDLAIREDQLCATMEGLSLGQMSTCDYLWPAVVYRSVTITARI